MLHVTIKKTNKQTNKQVNKEAKKTPIYGAESKQHQFVSWEIIFYLFFI